MQNHFYRQIYELSFANKILSSLRAPSAISSGFSFKYTLWHYPPSLTLSLSVCLSSVGYKFRMNYFDSIKVVRKLHLTFFHIYLQCWDECTASTSINKSILDTWALDVTSMVRDSSLVATNIAWKSSAAASDCLVTWEVSGGGLIGNLLTQSSNVELSLWPDTKYRVQVTCKNKVSNGTEQHLNQTNRNE